MIRLIRLLKWLGWAFRRRGTLVDIRDLMIGGHCGLCGAWVEKAIVSKESDGWTVCNKCAGEDLWQCDKGDRVRI